MRKIAISMFLLALAAAVAGAQMTGGGRGMPGHTPGTGTTPGTGNGGMMPGMVGARGDMGPQNVIVTSQGTAIVTRATDSNNDGTYELELLALTPAGTSAWKRSLTGLGFVLGLSNDLVLAVEQPTTIDPTKPLTTMLVAYDVASGNERWRLAVDGIPMNAEPFAGGTYVTVVNRPLLNATPTPGTRMGPGTAALWAVGPGGTVLWKYDLTQ